MGGHRSLSVKRGATPSDSRCIHYWSHALSDRYRIPKTRIPVEIRNAGGAAEKCTLFLGEARNGPESVLDHLNAEQRFLVVEAETRQVSFRGRERIAMVTLSDADAFAEHGGLQIAADLATEAPLHLEFDDGSQLEGVTVYELQESSSRIQDFLNDPHAFFPFFHDAQVSYVNKDRIARVTLREASET